MNRHWRSGERIRTTRPGLASARFVALFLLGVVAFNPPLMAIFDVDTLVLGVPLLYVYLFAAWAVLIALVRLTAERSEARADTAALDEGPRYPPSSYSGGR